MKKTYLHPRHMRFGAPVINFILHDQYGYWLGTHCEENPDASKEVKGLGEAYFRTCTKAISKELYIAFMTEAKENFRRYKKREPVSSKDILSWAKS